MVVSDVVLGGLTAAMDGLTSQLKAAISFADTAQKASLALGLTYEDTKTSLGGTMEGLRGDINQKFAAGIAGMEAGLQGNTAGVAKLINQQMLTGTAYRQTAKAFALLESGMGLAREETNALSNNLIKTGDEYQISTDKLVESISALKATFPAQKLAGMGANVMGAVTKLQGELGPQLAGPLNSVMKMVMDTSMEGYSKLTKLGIGDVRERLAASKSAAESQQILKDAFVTASKNFKSVAGDASQGFFQIGVASKIFGEQSINFTTIADNFGNRVKKEGEEATDFGKTLANLKKEIMEPFQQSLSKFYPIILNAFEGLSVMVRRVMESFGKWVEKAIPNAETAFKFLTLKVIDFATYGLNAFGKFKNFVAAIADEWFPKLSNSFKFVENAIHFGIIIPMELVKITFNSFLNGLDSLILAITAVYVEIFSLLDSFPGIGDWSKEQAAAESMRDDTLSRMLERSKAVNDSVDRMMTTPGQSAVEFSKKLKDANNDPSLLGNRLLADLRESIENGSEIQKEQKQTLEDINDKTPEKATSSSFLDETADMLGRSIEGILGVGRDTTAEEMLEALQEANEQRASAAANAPIGLNTSIPTGA